MGRGHVASCRPGRLRRYQRAGRGRSRRGCRARPVCLCVVTAVVVSVVSVVVADVSCRHRHWWAGSDGEDEPADGVRNAPWLTTRRERGRRADAARARRRCGGGPIRMGEKRESARGGSQKTSAIPSALQQQQRQSDYSVSLYNVDKQRRSVQQHGVCLSSEALGRFHHVLRPEEGLDRPGPGRSHLECQL